MSNQPTVKMKVRTNGILLAAMMVFALLLVGRLFHVSVLDNKTYQDLANARHFGSIPIPANRGSIYDANGKILAQSATVYKIYLDPSLYRTEMEALRTKETENAAKALADGKTYHPVDYNAVESALVTYLAQQLDITEEDIRAALLEQTKYKVLKNKVDKPIADAILAYCSEIPVDENNSISLHSISRESDTKRYYPQNNLAASVIGFTNSDGAGLYGLESQYDEYLSGTDGKVISAKDLQGNEMPYRYAKTYDAQDGNSLYLTIDTTLQTYLESSLDEMVNKFEVANRSCGIIMNAKTGAILAMSSNPGFDLNDPYTIYDSRVSTQLQTLDEAAYKDAYIAEREKQWKNKAITELYQPGSVFKVITASAGFEENAVKLDDHFTCTGAVTVAAGTKPIHCHLRSGHGTQDFTQALANSCNPAFIEIGRRLGAELFSQYFTAFGLTERTGIDLPGEATSYYQGLDGMGPVELASCSFGQTNIITPIEMITSYAAVINGGNLLTPYVVSKIVDSDGNVVKTNETNVKRQVISAETSATMRTALENVVKNKQGGNAYIKGYRIGGKSGTSQKIGGAGYNEEEMEYIASYVCFAPADDPEIIMLIMADQPNQSIAYYGSTVAVPYARKVLEKALPYLGYYPEYTEEELAKLPVKVPFLGDQELESAKQSLSELGLTYEIIGDGNIVYSQTPITGTHIATGGTVLLYTDGYTTDQTVTVPSLIGMSLSQANTTLAGTGLNYITAGASTDRADAKIQSQSIEPGATVSKWSVLELEFVVNTQSD